MSGQRPLPDFICIGALKAGTTYLDALLRSHPQLGLPRNIKETDFFSTNWERGYEWYESLFRGYADDQVLGEVSPSYVTHESSAARIADVQPTAKLVMSLRHPETRLVSQYRHWVQETGYSRPFGVYLDEHPNALAGSHYLSCLAPWLTGFARPSWHFVVFEQLTSEPELVARDLFRFLGVDDDFAPPTSAHDQNSSSPHLRFPRGYRLARRVARRLQLAGAGGLVEVGKRHGLRRFLKGGEATGQPEVAEDLRSMIPERLRTSMRIEAGRLGDELSLPLAEIWYPNDG